MALGATALTVVLAVSGYTESVGSAGCRRRAPAAVVGIVLSFSLVPPSSSPQPRHPAPLSTAPERHRGAWNTRGHRMNEWNIAPQDVLERLNGLRQSDAPTHGGRVLSYVYDSGRAELDELAAAAIRAVQPRQRPRPDDLPLRRGRWSASSSDSPRTLFHGDDDVVGIDHLGWHRELPAGCQDRARCVAGRWSIGSPAVAGRLDRARCLPEGCSLLRARSRPSFRCRP